MTPDPQLLPMPKYNADNERTKRRYFTYLKEAKRRSERSVDGAAKAIRRFEVDTGFRSFKAFHREQAVAFKRHLAEQLNERTGKPLSKATLHSTLTDLKALFVWLADRPGFRSRLAFSDADYFNSSERDARIATTRREGRAPSLDLVRQVIASMPAADAIQRRDRALVAFILLTGARDGAVASFKLKHVDLVEGCVTQDAREVKTKFGKSFTTWFVQAVGDDIRTIVDDWVRYLSKDLLWGPDDPLFPATRVEGGLDKAFRATGLERRHWASADPIRRIFRRAFAAAGYPYYPPHRLRDTLATLGEKLCRTPEQFKAFSQNIGHTGVLTTFMNYGEVPQARQAELIRGLADRPVPSVEVVEEMAAVVAKYRGAS
jgi:integrase/recombinase XerD